MKVANTLNNTIRILFNPKIESFRLFDFLMVKSTDNRYLAQIFEIYEDKFDSSQNVAKLKLFYKITENNEVMPYDNFTPSKECEILKVKPDEVEAFINGDKETFAFATDAKTSQALNIQYDFFNKNPIILADKIENANAVSINLAKKLSAKKKVVLVDFSGIVEFDEIKKIKACKNLKLPLNFSTLDFVFDKCLIDATLEFQALGLEILNALKKFAKKQEDGFIPFNSFINVILQQYEATPYPELQLLIERMKRYQLFDIFAKNKKDYESFSKLISKNDISIVDLSGIGNIWQKAFVEYIIDELKDDVYLLLRVSEECFDTELTRKVYNEKKNIKFIPNVSYSYSKLPSIIQYCNNFILLPSLLQRSDFLDANFALSKVISNECILFGETTDNFLYLAKDYELENQEKRKNYRKIALSLLEDEPEEKETIKEEIQKEQEEEKKVSDSQRLIQELSEFEEQNIKKHEKIEKQEVSAEIETFKNIQEIKLSNEPEEETNDEFANIEEATEEDKEDIFQPLTDKNTISEESQQTVEISSDTNDITPNEAEIIDDEKIDIIEAEPDVSEEETSEVVSEEISENQSDETSQGEAQDDEKQEAEEQGEEKSIMDDIFEPENNDDENKEIDLSDEELDFFELAKNSAQPANEANEGKEEQSVETVEELKIDESEENIISDTETIDEDNDLDLSEVASGAIENNFTDIINTKTTVNKPSFEIDENTTIQVDVNEAKEESLPIFKEEQIEDTKSQNNHYTVGAVAFHKKYGKGTIIKIIQYDKRQLLQIDFVESGKKLLDPKIAEIQLEQ